MRDPKSQNESNVTVSPTLGIFVPNFGRVWCKNKMCEYLAFILGTYIPQVNPGPTKRKCSQNENVYKTKAFTKRKPSQCENVRSAKTFAMRKRSQYENVHKTKTFIIRKRIKGKCSQDENVHKRKRSQNENVYKMKTFTR